MAFELSNRVVLITGASSGIGRACAAAFHGAGCNVVITARSEDRLHMVAEALGGERILVAPGDITDLAHRTRLVARAHEVFGRIDVLVNNAGWASFGTVEKVPLEHVNTMLGLNFVAPVALVQAVLPEMRERGQGQIVNVASVVGHQPMPWMTVYSATKAALLALSTGLRLELRGTGVDVIAIAPSSTRTDFFDVAASIDARATRVAETQYTPERVAEAIVRACQRRKREVILSAEGKAIALIRRFTRRGADRLMYEVAKRGMPRKANEE
jgi:short-subunit dehydrogenase